MRISRSPRVVKTRRSKPPQRTAQWRQVLYRFWYPHQQQLDFSEKELILPSLKRARPSEFDHDTEQRSCKIRELAFDPEVEEVTRKPPCDQMHLTTLYRTSTKAERYFTSMPPFPKPSSSTLGNSSSEDDDDTLSVCSTDTDYTAHSWDLEDSSPYTGSYNLYQDPKEKTTLRLKFNVNLESPKSIMYCMQARAANIDLSLSEYDRSFSLPDCTLLASEEIEHKEPTDKYATLLSTNIHAVGKALEALHLEHDLHLNVLTQQFTPVAIHTEQDNGKICEVDIDIKLQEQSRDEQRTFENDSGADCNPLVAQKEDGRSALSNKEVGPFLDDLSNSILGSSPNLSSHIEPAENAVESFENSEISTKQILGKRKTQRDDPFVTIREHIGLVPLKYHKLIETMLLQCENHDLVFDAFPRSVNDRPRFENLADALSIDQPYGFNFTGAAFNFQELHPATAKRWYMNLFQMATKEEDDFQDLLRTVFMAGVHPKDCFPRNSEWIEYFFENRELCLNNRRVDDIYTMRDRECNMKDPPYLDLPHEWDLEWVERFRAEGSLDILQKAVVDWLDVDDEELRERRAEVFEDAMDAAHLCDSESNQLREDLFKWLDGCDQMGSNDTHNNPERAWARSVLEEALLKLFEYRYPRSWNLGVNESLLPARNDQEIDDDEDWEVDNRILGRP